MNYSGFLLINKPSGRSSHSCVAQVRRCVGKEYKVGHGGTLDPFATGLLIVAVGRSATKHLSALLTCDKKYIARGQLGLLTDTLDCSGEEINKKPCEDITINSIQNAINFLGNSYIQTPPLVCAKKHEGDRLYQLFRRGKKTYEELNAIAGKKSRTVILHKISLLSFDLPFFNIKAHVSHGTYIRSLVQDIAQLAGSCATTIALERTAIGPFKLAKAVALDDLQKLETINAHLIPIETFLAKL